MSEWLRKLWADPAPRFRVARMLVLAAILIPITTTCSLMYFERNMIFYPTSTGRWDLERLPRPAGAPAALIEDVFFEADDGVKLHGWYATDPNAATERVLLYFHGNAGNLSDRYEFVLGLLTLPARVFVIDYRGYGRSEGSPSEAGLYRDAEAAWRYLTTQRGHVPEDVVLFGKSLGGAPATYLAEKVPAAGLIAQSTFTSIPDVAGFHFPIVPRFLISTKMASVRRIEKAKMPKLIVHSPADEVIPFKLGRRLYEAAAPPKHFLEIPGAGHNETALVGGDLYWDGMREFVGSL